MSPLRYVVDAFLRSAGRRWPADISAAMLAEWRAELAHLRATPATGWRQLAFALSLAVSPAAGPRVSWRERVPRIGPATTTTLLYVAVAVPARELWPLGGERLALVADPTGAGFGRLAGIGAAVVVMAVAGVLTGRRVPVAAGRRPLLGAAAVVAPLAAVDFWRPDVLPFDRWLIGTSVSIAIGVWAILMTVTLALTRRWAARGRWLRAVLAGLVGLLVATDAATAVGIWPAASRAGFGPGASPEWLPLSLLGPAGPDFGGLIQNSVLADPSQPESPGGLVARSAAVLAYSPFCLPLLLCAVFAVVATLVGARRPATVAAPATPAARPIARPLRLLGAALVAAGAFSWAMVLHWHGFDWFGIRAAIEPGGLFATIQLGALVLAGCGTAMLVAGRGPVAVPSALVPVAMLVAARELHRSGVTGAAAATLGVLVVAAAVAAAYRLSVAVGRALPELTPATTRRALLFVAVTASLSIPAGFSPTYQHRLLLVEYGVAGALGLGAAAAALGARAVPPNRLATAAVLAIGLAAGLAGGSHALSRAAYWFSASLLLQVPLMLLLVLVATPPGRLRAWVGWALGSAIAITATVVFGFVAQSFLGPPIALAVAAVLCRRAPAAPAAPTRPMPVLVTEPR